MVDFMRTGAYADLRDGLRARLDEIRHEKQQVQGRLRELELAEASYAKALEAENRRFHTESAVPSVPPVRQRAFFGGGSGEPLDTRGEVPVEAALDALWGGSTKDFLLKTMADGRNWSLDSLKGLAEQQKLFVPEGSSLGRMLHGALLGLKQSGQVVMVDRGVWRKA